MLNYAEAESQIKAGDVRPMMVLTSQRLKILPDVPTAKEVGIDADYATVRGFVTLKGVPDDRLKMLEDGLMKAMQGQMYATYIETSGQAPDSVAPRAAWQAQLDAMYKEAESELKALGPAEVSRVRREDLVVAAVALAACVVAFALTFRFTTTTPAAMMSGMGAEFFPRLVIAVMAVLAVCIVFGIGNPPMEKPGPVPASVWITAGVLAAFVAAVELLGMWLASFVLMVGLGRMWGEKQLPEARAWPRSGCSR